MTTSCYVYAILPRETRLPPDLSGFAGATLSTVPYHALAAATSQIDPRELRPTTEYVLQHEAVVEGLRQLGPTLPVRFGTVLPDTDAVASVLAKRYVTLAGDMARLGDKVELGLTVLWDQPIVNSVSDQETGDDRAPVSWEVEAQGPGARYLQNRLAEYRREAAVRARAKAIARDLDMRLGAHTLEHRCTIVPTPRLALRATYLVDPVQVQAFQEAFEELRRVHPDLRFLLSGPWPPYSFVTRPESGERSAAGGGTGAPDQRGPTGRPTLA